MAKRYQMKKKNSKKLFSKTAKKVNRKNSFSPMRGGLRI